jgi:ABC-2 type transport system permease protein
MNIYLHELRAYWKNTLIWTLSLCAGTFFIFSMFPAFSANATALSDALKNYPLMIQLAFGLFIDQIGSVNGFYSFIVTVLTLIGSVQAMTLGLSVVSKETTGRTADFLLTKPVTRGHVAVSKILAVFTCILVTSAVFIGASVGCATAVSGAPFAHKSLLLMALTFFFVQTMFLALGFVVATVVPKIRSVLPVALSWVFAFFALGTVAAMLENEKLYYLSPFKYFETRYILTMSAYKPSFVLAAVLVVAGCVIAGFVVFTRRDVHAA